MGARGGDSSSVTGKPFRKTGLLTEASVHDIEQMLSDYFNPRVNLIVPNVSWGFFLGHEADLVVVTPSGYLTEIEIKRSWPDFLADFRKADYHDDARIARFYYAVPECMLQACIDYVHFEREGFFLHGQVPGFIAFTSFDDVSHRRVRIAVEPVRGTLGRPVKLSDSDIQQLSRLGALRYWSLLPRLREAERKNSVNPNDSEVLRLKSLLTEIKADYKAVTGESWRLEAL